MRKKPKKKAKGKNLYKNTHGNMHRVISGYKHRRMIQRRKMLRNNKSQLGK